MVSEEVTTCAKTHSLPTPDTGALCGAGQGWLPAQGINTTQGHQSNCLSPAVSKSWAVRRHLQFQLPDNFVLPEAEQGDTETSGDKHARAQPEEATP